MKQQTLHIDPEFKAQIPPLTEDERKQLEENILADGEILSPLLVWNDTIVDGHNRYEILQNHPEIPYNVRSLYLETREEVLAWICKNQLGRRNLTPEQKKFLIGKQYDAEKRAEGFHGNQHTVPAAPAGVQNEHQRPAEKTCERIARENHVSASSVRRAALFAQGVDLADKLYPGIRLQVFRGVLNVPDALFERLAKARPEEHDAILEQIKNPQPRAKPAVQQKAPQPPERRYPVAKLPDVEPHFIEVEYGDTHGEASDTYAQLDIAAVMMQETWRHIFEQMPSLRTDPEQRKTVRAILEKHLSFLALLGCTLPESLEAGDTKPA